jgi:hypothetical protein
MTSIVVQNLTDGSSVTADLTITAVGGDSISNTWEDKKYGVCNWNGSSCSSWQFPHGGALACSNHSTCTGTLTVVDGQTQQADYGSLLDMKRSHYGVQALNQNTTGAGATISVVVTSTKASPARIKVTLKSFDDFTDKLVEQSRIVDLPGIKTPLLDGARTWGGAASESSTQPCPIGETTAFEAEVRYNGKTARCSQSVPPPPADSCGRKPQTDTLASNPHYGSKDCCDGIALPDTFRAYDKIDFKVQESFGDYQYKDGRLQWTCQRNSSAVTVANPTAMYNLAFLGWSNQAKTYLNKLMTHAFNRDGTTFMSDLDRKVYGGSAGVALKKDINDGVVANSCFVCGQTRTVGGCFPPGVRITTGDGSTSQRVEEIRAGDLLWNPVLKRGFKVITISEGPERNDLVVVRAGAQILRMTTEHPVLTKGEMKQAIQLTRGETVIDHSGHEVTIEAITREPASPGLSVINFVMERSGNKDDGILIADGLVVGDLTIQRRLAADAAKKK